MDSYSGSGPRKFIPFCSGELRKEITSPTTHAAQTDSSSEERLIIVETPVEIQNPSGGPFGSTEQIQGSNQIEVEDSDTFIVQGFIPIAKTPSEAILALDLSGQTNTTGMSGTSTVAMTTSKLNPNNTSEEQLGESQSNKGDLQSPRPISDETQVTPHPGVSSGSGESVGSYIERFVLSASERANLTETDPEVVDITGEQSGTSHFNTNFG